MLLPMFNRNVPYNNLPGLPPPVEIESKEILKKAIKANKALAKLVGSGRQLPNQSMLINSIALQEAKMSSEIENIITTNDELYQALTADKQPTDPSTKEVLHYQHALWEGYQIVKQKGFISTNLFVRIFNIVKETTAGVINMAGTKISNKKTQEIIYTPPEGEDIIREKLKDLENFVNNSEDEIDPLIKMAIIHYQFEAIHPFSDGNGRTGRILNILYLVNNDLLEIPILYLSKYIIEHRKAYYNGLRLVTEENRWHEWIMYMLDAIETTALFTQQKIDAIASLMQETDEFLRDKAADIYSKELLEIIFRQPYSKRKFFEDAGIVKKKTAGTYLARLEDLGLLQSIIVGKEKLYINHKLFNILKR